VKPVNITKNLELWSGPASGRETPPQRLVVILAWMMARKKHLAKYGEFYFKQGFDVLYVQMRPIDLVWPEKGSQVIAGDFVNFLHDRPNYDKVMVHAFSVGAYQYGECLVKMKQDLDKYGDVIKRIRGQIIDSGADFNAIPKGFPAAVTDNKVLQKLMEISIRLHQKVYYNTVTKHYLMSESTFYNNPVRTPAIFFFSKTDPVSTQDSNIKVIQSWEKLGMKVNAKCWESSPHCMHMPHHTDEYLEGLSDFMNSLGLLAVPYKRPAIANNSKL